MKRTLIIIAVVIVLLGVGVAAYFTFFTKKASVIVTPSDNTFPVGGDAAQTPDADTTATVATPGNPTPVSARLVKISAGPVVPGAAVVNRKAVNASSSPDVAVNYIERQSGNVYSYSVRGGTLTRTNNKTVPGIQSADWLPSGARAFVRYLSGENSATINTYALSADGTDGGGFFLPQNLSGIAVSSTSVLALSSGANGSVASLTNTDGTHSTEIFTTPLSALHASFAGKGQYFAYNNSSATLQGAAFLVDAQDNFSRVAGPAYGLVAKASPSGKWVLVSSSDGGVLQMNLINVATRETLPLPVATIADKCVWTIDDASIYCGVPTNPPTNATYPDDWYQGALSFTDRIWKIQVAGRYAQFVLDFSKETSGSLDATALAIDPLGTTLVFMNKTDGSLWSYSL